MNTRMPGRAQVVELRASLEASTVQIRNARKVGWRDGFLCGILFVLGAVLLGWWMAQ